MSGKGLRGTKLCDISMNHPKVVEARAIIEKFRVENGLEYSPKINLDNCFKVMAKYDMSCLCSMVKKCPRPECLEDIKKNGICHCRFLCTKETYNKIIQGDGI